MRILHVGRNSANQAGYAVHALRRLGHDAELWEYGPDSFGYAPDRTIELATKDPLIFWRTFREASESFDVIHFHAARSFFPGEWGGVPAYWDLPILRALGLKIFHTFHGSDCRIKRIHLEDNPWSYFKYSDINADDDRTEKTIQIFRTYCHKLFVVAPDYKMFVPEAEVIGRIIDISTLPEQEPHQREVPRILHVPSRRGTKGTDMILDGLRALEAGGVKFDFSLLEGISHEAAKRAIADADVVIDNVVTGDYELVSIETMASSRVAVANIQRFSREAYPDAPVWDVDPITFGDRMRELIANVGLRRGLAARGRTHVARHHDAAVAARTYLRFYEMPDALVPQRTFPDWATIAYARSIERLEQRVAGLEQALARARVRAGDTPQPARLARWLPGPAVLGLRRLKVRAKDSVPSGIRTRIVARRDRRFRRRAQAGGAGPPRSD